VAIVFLGFLVFGGLALFSERAIDPDAIANQVASATWQTRGLFFLLAIAFTALGLPRQLVAFVCGYVFGFLPGLGLSLLAAVLGCAVAFWFARTVLREWVGRRYASMVETLDRLVQHDAFMKIVVLRIQPLGTNLLTNLCAGVSGIKPALFFSSTAIGYLPQMIVFGLAGDGIRLGDTSRLLLSGLLLLVSLLLAAWLWQRHKLRVKSLS